MALKLTDCLYENVTVKRPWFARLVEGLSPFKPPKKEKIMNKEKDNHG